MELNKRALALGLGAAGVAGVALARRSQHHDPTEDFTAHGFARRLVATPAGAMNVYEAGNGPPLVFLHGMGVGMSAWTWSKIAPAFTADYRVIVPDWVGWGLSEHPQRWLLIEDYVAELDALLKHVDAPAFVVAQSLAAGFVADLARIKPELFRRLVLHTPAGGRDFGNDTFARVLHTIVRPVVRRQPLNQLIYKLGFRPRTAIQSWLRSQGFYDPAGVSDEIINGFVYSARQPNAAWSALPFVAGDLFFDFAVDLHELNVPAAIFWGAHERQIGRHVGERLAAIDPSIPFALIEQARATPELELPGQTIAVIERLLGMELERTRTV